ncbi:MAG: N-acetyl-gamma-glutamyl-phosphate reductase [Verrucomicrobiae bacterium]|nr:N-acetyl-gamma-glutamyl-phosphate reductase [Verrucomicrobiae bacterium]
MKEEINVQAVIIGASGYSGEELVRLLIRHPRVHLAGLTSRQHFGKKLAEVFPRFANHPDAKTIGFIKPEPDLVRKLLKEALLKESSKDLPPVVFLALPHGVAFEWAAPMTEAGACVIDLSADFRLRDASVYLEYYGHPHPTPGLMKDAIYGLPEINRSEIRKARLIASPGCYPTSILLPLIPLLREKLIDPAGIVVNSLSGVTGAGRKAEEAFLFCECNESLRAYGVPKHRHLSEIEQELSLAARKPVVIQFTPHLVPVNRGIHTTICVRPAAKLKDDVSEAINRCYQQAYANEPFVRMLGSATMPDTKRVTMTNVIEIGHRFDPRSGNLLIFSAEDNLTKGAAGQAIQSMNIVCGFPETTGLQ